MNDALTLRNDYLFKRLLGAEENKARLQDFLECVLDMEVGSITDLELLDKELSKDVITDKTGILDVKARLKDGTSILALLKGLLKIGGADTRREHKLTAGTVANVHPCTFATYVFAAQTRC